jgi:hypothetical protein
VSLFGLGLRAMVVLRAVQRSRGAPSTPLGRPSAPTLPASLRSAWVNQRLPEAVLAEAGASPLLSYGQLDRDVHRRTEYVEHLVRHVMSLVRSRRNWISAIRIFEANEPGVNIQDPELGESTWRALSANPSLVQAGRPGTVTWGELRSARSGGVRSAFELAMAVERGRHNSGASKA